MKLHSGWLAAGLLIFAVLACTASKNTNDNSNSNNSNNKNSNSSSSSNRPANAEIYIERINMAKDKDGEPGDNTTSFDPSDRPVHCVVRLNKAKAGTQIRFVWKAVDVEGMRSGDSTDVDYTTNSFENIVHSHFTPKDEWHKGKYKVEVYVNGLLDKSIDFSVE